MFMGTYYNSIDAKNRMIVPFKHRDQLGGKCVITKGLDKCLYIYSLPDWEKQLEKIAVLPESDPKVRGYIRHVCANALECDFDKQGRIVIPDVYKRQVQAAARTAGESILQSGRNQADKRQCEGNLRQ